MNKRQKEQFLSDFRKYRDDCNKIAEKKGYKQNYGDKYFISVIIINEKPKITVSSTNNYFNELILLGYFYNIKDAKNAIEKYKKSIMKLYEYEF